MQEIKEYVFLVDKSISMHGKEAEVLEVLNGCVRDCGTCGDEAYATLGLFSEHLEILYIHNEWQCVRPLNRNVYFVEGNTALFDAVCEICSRISSNLNRIKDEIHKHIEIFVITDGIDNASVYNDAWMCFEELIRRTGEGWKIHFRTPEGRKIDLEHVCKNM